MEPDRLARVAGALTSPATPPGLDGVVAVCVDLLEVSGAGIAVISDGQHRGAMALSDPALAAIDELQFSLGEGPCIDADRQGRPVLEPRLAETLEQWPAWSPAAMEQGVNAAFSFALHIGAARLGTLNLYRDVAGELSDRSLADALLLANVGTRLLLDLEAGAPPGALPARLSDAVEHRAKVHQATGMVAAQLATSVAQALTRLRAHARATGTPIDEVAAEVLARRLRFD